MLEMDPREEISEIMTIAARYKWKQCLQYPTPPARRRGSISYSPALEKYRPICLLLFQR